MFAQWLSSLGFIVFHSAGISWSNVTAWRRKWHTYTLRYSLISQPRFIFFPLNHVAQTSAQRHLAALWINNAGVCQYVVDGHVTGSYSRVDVFVSLLISAVIDWRWIAPSRSLPWLVYRPTTHADHAPWEQAPTSGNNLWTTFRNAWWSRHQFTGVFASVLCR